MAETGNLKARYLRGIGLLAQVIDGKCFYYLHNVHRDVVQRVSESGDPAPLYRYDAFGNQREPVETDPNPFRYCGEYFDGETQSVYLRARYYDPGTGRFGQEDSAKDGLNWYTYCGGNPVNCIDPSGCLSLSKKKIDFQRDDSGGSFWKDASRAVSGFVSDQGQRGKTFFDNPNPITLADWLTYGVFFSANAARYNDAKSSGSAYDYANWLLSGRLDMIQGAFNPDEPLSLEHWMNSLGTVLLIYGGYRGIKNVQANSVSAYGTSTSGSFAVKSGASGSTKPMDVVRTINHGEKIVDLIDEVKTLTFSTGNEHAVVTLANGQRAIVSGGTHGISFGSSEITRLFGHTHPYQGPVTGPSLGDYQALSYLGQNSSYLLEHGQLSKFYLK